MAVGIYIRVMYHLFSYMTFLLQLDDPHAVSSLPSRHLKLFLVPVAVCLPFMSGSVANLKVTFPDVEKYLYLCSSMTVIWALIEGRKMVQSLDL